MMVLSRISRLAPGWARRRPPLASVASLLAVVLMVLAAVAIGRFSLNSAERDRLDERSRLVQQMGHFTTSTYDPDTLRAAAARTPFPEHNPALAARLLEQFRTGPTGDSAAVAALVRTDGNLVVSSPAGVTPPTTEFGDAWIDALSGTARQSLTFDYHGKPSWAVLAPVGSGTPWAVLIVIENSMSTSAQTFAEQLGTIAGTSGGGLSALDTEGRAFVSWNPKLLNTRLLDPAVANRLPVGRSVTITTGTGAAQITTIVVHNIDGSSCIFRQSTSSLFADLQAEQQRRDLTLLGLLAVAVGGLILASVLRVRAVRRNRARLHTLLSNTEDLIVVVATDTTLTFVSPTLHTLLGFDAEAWMNRPLTTYTHPDDVERLTQLVNNPDGMRTVLDIRLRDHDDTYRWFDIEAGDVSDDPELRGVLLTCHSVGERKALQDQLIQQARHDVLTGLPNRLMLTRQLTTALTNAAVAGASHPAASASPDDAPRDTGRRAAHTANAEAASATAGANAAAAGSTPPARPALLFIDLDRFKHVNDRYGHEAGDQVLHAVAERLNALVREGDLVCRFGGDEFGIVLQAATPTGAQHIAERIVSALSQPITIGTEPTAITTTVQIGASVGIAIAAPGLDHPDTLLRAADGAMYRAKELGRGQAVMWGQDVGKVPPVGNALAVAPAMANGGAPAPNPANAETGPTPAELATRTSELTPSVDDTQALAPQPLSTTDLTLLRARADADANRHRGAWRRQLRSMASLAVVSLAIIAVAGLGFWQTAQARQADERQRVAERLALTVRVGQYAWALANLQRLIAPVSAAPWALDGSIVDALVVHAVLSSDLASNGAQVTLRTTGGKILATSSSTLQPIIEPGSIQWQDALRGEVGYRVLSGVHGKISESYAIPVIRHGKVAAVLTVDQELKNSVSEELLESLGSLGFGDGGVSSLDLSGRVKYSWNPDLIGRQLIPRSAIANIPSGRAVTVDTAADGTVTLAILVPTPVVAHRVVIIFQQSTAVFYGDLRSGQRPRDIALFAVVAVAIGLLGAARWQREQLLHRSEKHLDALLRNAHDIVVVTTGGNATFISSAITGLLDHHSARWLNQPLAGLIHRDDRSRLDEYTRAVVRAGAQPAQVDAQVGAYAYAHAAAYADAGSGLGPGAGVGPGGGTLHDVRLLAADGSYRWFDLYATDLSNRPEVAGIIFTCHEVGERKALQDELSYRARHDALTGLPNRSVFNQRLETLTHADENDDPGYTVLFIDLDRFKPVNDTFGHDAGDAVLRSVAHRLGKSASENPGSLTCRLGGDEFAILLPGVNGPAATQLATNILYRVRQPITIHGATGQAVQIGATIGIAYARYTDNPAAVVKRADEAMYEAKDSGRGRYAVHAG